MTDSYEIKRILTDDDLSNVNNELLNKVDIDTPFEGAGEVVVAQNSGSVKGSGVDISDIVTKDEISGMQDLINDFNSDISNLYNIIDGTVKDLKFKHIASHDLTANGAIDLSTHIEAYDELMIIALLEKNGDDNFSSTKIGIANNNNNTNAGYQTVAFDNLTGASMYIKITMNKTDTTYRMWNMMANSNNLSSFGRVDTNDNSNIDRYLKIYSSGVFPVTSISIYGR